MDNIALVKTLYEAFGRGDIPAVLEHLDDAIEWATPLTLPQGGHFTGKEGALHFFQGLGASWDPLSVDVEGIGELSDGRVVAVVQGSGQLRTGGPGAYGAAHVFTVRNHKVVRFQEFVDLDKPLG